MKAKVKDMGYPGSAEGIEENRVLDGLTFSRERMRNSGKGKCGTFKNFGKLVF